MRGNLSEHVTETMCEQFKQALINTALETYEVAYEYYTKGTNKFKADEHKKLAKRLRELQSAIIDYERRAHWREPTVEAFLTILDNEDDLYVAEIIAVCIGIVGLFKLTPVKLKPLLNSLVIRAEPDQNIIVTFNTK